MSSTAAQLNINAKPFTPSFGGGGDTAAGASTATANKTTGQQQGNSTQGTSPARGNKPPQQAQQTLLPPPPPPMGMNPFMPMGMMGMGGFGMGGPMMGGGPNGMMMGNPLMHGFNNPMMNRGGAFYPPPHMGGGMGMGMGMNVPPSPMYGANNKSPQQQLTVTVGAPGGKAIPNGGSTPLLGTNAATHTPPHQAQKMPSSTNNSFAAAHASQHNVPQQRKPVTLPRKVAFLVLGGRGSGKTTQCERLAKQYNLLHIAGGQFAAEKKLPLVELVRVLRENFVEGAELGKAAAKPKDPVQLTNNSSPGNNSPGVVGTNTNTTAAAGGTIADGTPNAHTPESPTHAPSAAAGNQQQSQQTNTITAPKEYNGIVLDRMVGLHEYDAYYLDHILRSFGFAVELVFLLMLDSETAIQRAVSRGDGKPVDHTRQMAEHRVQYAAVNSVYSPLKILHCVECDNMPVEAISRALERVIDTQYSSATAATTVPPVPSVPHHPYTQGKCKLVTDFEKFYKLRNDMLIAVHDTPKPPVVCPASLMTGICDRRMFVSAKQARPLVNSYATLKADGQRVLLFKTTQDNAIYGINGIFHFIYDFTQYFATGGITLPPKPDSYVTPEHGIEWVLDAECFSVEGRTQIAVFDYLFLYGSRANTQFFDPRLDALKDFFGKVTIAENPVGTAALYGPSPFFLKKYAPAVEIRSLLPDPARPPFPIDGIVFQHLSGYKFGRDNCVFKWKPREKCTVDFRLDKAVDPQIVGGEWSFVPMVSEDKEEVPWPNAQIRATDADARRCDLCDGTIAECVKREMGTAATTTGTTNAAANAITIWDFVRVRPEKATPNRLEIAKRVDSMEHMTFEELAKTLEAFRK